MEDVLVSNLWDVRIDLYVIGYPTQGESIITIFSEGRKILKSIVTDCYSEADRDCIAEILNSYENPKIDWFVWTHPHEDHSKGIPQLLDSFDGQHNGHIFIPANLHNIPENLLCKEALEALSYLKNNYCQKGNIGPRRHRNYHTVQFDCDVRWPTSYIFQIHDSVSESIIPVSLYILGPDNIEALQNSDGTKQLKENALSVIYTLDVNGLVMFMAADITDKGAELIPIDYYKHFHFLKIPHHGSNEPKTFYNRTIENDVKDSIGVTTRFLSKNMPRLESMRVYSRNLGSVYSTHSKNNGSDFGYIHIQYNPMEMKLTEDPKVFGNAGAYIE